MTITVTGASGHLGHRVIKALLKLTIDDNIRAGVHNPEKLAAFQKLGVQAVQLDYFNNASMDLAFNGTDVLVYIPSKTYNVLKRVAELESVLTAAKKAAVSQIIFVSFFADQETNPFTMSPFYGYAPRRLAGFGIPYAVVKNSLFADPLVPYLPELIERQALIYPVGDQKLAFITQADSAEAIAQLAVNPELRGHGETYLLSQEETFDMPTLGALMTDITGHPIGYQPVSTKAFADIYRSEGDGDELSSMYLAGEIGLMAATSKDFQKLTGHAPETMATFLKRSYQPEN
ncbi:NAD(P)H-binding protein [Secundilactobacillus kimchicus]|uniref:NmrA family NAD(P)-binding protein n=1 Tax=Secundilactobacillus kimchicus TaxID=528209 RepID=UPI001C020DE8|nr:NAD(P)H-binding protein [Secundilactobacillus kimchicus]MBT9671211.1 NAD(P)H-binding protein [Secundilactobacillus kimchicus]